MAASKAIYDSPALTFSDAVAAISGQGSRGGWYNGLCPAHEDSTPSLGIKERPDGTFAVKCQAGCSRRQVMKALEERTGKRSGAGLKNKRPPLAGLTLARYAEMKRLPQLFLGILFRTVQTTHNGLPAVQFPYCDENEACAGIKLRLSESSHDACWQSYTRPLLFGLDVLTVLQRDAKWDLSRVVLCEGESDTQTLVFHGIPALGVSGKQGWKAEFANITILKSAKEIFVIQEPDAKNFADGVVKSFPAGKAHRMVLPAKDPSELWINSTPQEFDVAWAKAIEDAYDNSIPFTDTGNAERLVKTHGQNFRWVTDEEAFHVWNGTVWQRNESGDILLPHTKEVVRTIADPEWRLSSESSGRRRSMIAMTKGETPVLAESSQFDKPRMLLNVQNGTLDLETLHFHEFCREDFLTKKAAVEYDPFARCPKFEAFLDFIFDGDKDTIDFILKALGYTLTGEVGESCFFICYGLGANGKTTLIEVLMQILGPDFARPAKFSTFVSSKMHDPKYEIATFKGRRLITAVEPKKAGHLDEEVLKQITGGDQIMARDIYQKNVVYYPEFKLWLAMNNKPRIIGTDDGIWRRVRFIPFSVKVPEHMKVKEFHRVLFAQEGPGILNRLLDGVRAWQEEGLQMSGAVARATAEFRDAQNVIQGFFAARTVSGERGLHAKAGDLYTSYKRWAEEQGEFVMRQNEFAEELARRGFEKRRLHDDGFHWFGVALNDASVSRDKSLAFGKSV